MLHWDWECIGQYFFAYNADFDLTSETIDGIYSKVLNRTYSTNGMKGRLTAMSIGDTALASYSYDAAGRVSGINNISFGYLANSNLLSTVTRPNNVNTTWSYEANRNLVTGVENKLNNTVISNYGYTNDALGRRTAMARSSSVFTAEDTLSYSYNDRSEVTGATSNAANTTYNYAYSFDNIGNRLTANLAGTPWTYTANNLNQYSAFTINQVAETPSYDDDGNMLTRDGWTQTWNGENRLIKAEKGTAKLEFAYDYMGRRIFKKVYNGETLTSHIRFVYDGYKLIEELNALNNNAVLRRYTWSPVGLDTPISVYDASANATYYYNTDANKNITELTDATDTVVAHYENSPFGKVLVANGAYASINPFRFSSEYHDDESSLVYYNYRYYSPELGRWLSRDPIGERGGWNLYIMTGNNVINFFDELGEKSSPQAALEAAIIRGDVAEIKLILDVSGDILSATMKSAARNFIKKAAKCQSIYIAYKSLKCSGCNKMTSQSIKQKNALCLTGEIAGRSNYLKLKCDYVLAGSIAAGSKAKETTHKIEIANKSVALAKCLCD